MRVAYGDLHPSIFDAADRLTSSMMSGASNSLLREEAEAIGKHQSVWVKTYGVGCGIACTVLGAITLGVPLALKSLGVEKPVVLLAFLAALLVSMFILYTAYQRNRKNMTAAELEALVPALQLTETQQAYIDAVLTLESLPSVPADEGREIVRHLNALLDEERRLAGYREWMKDAPEESLYRERERLRERSQSATDPVAKAAFEQSLEIVEQRITAAQAQSIALQRVEAQQEVIRQTILSIRESFGRMRGIGPEVPGLNLAALRQTVTTVHQQAQAVEAAVDEVRALAG